MKNPEKRSLIGGSDRESSKNEYNQAHANIQMYNATADKHGYQDFDSSQDDQSYSTLPLERRDSMTDGGITLCWKDICVSASIDQKRSCLSWIKGSNEKQEPSIKQILKNVDGVAKAGSFLVIMGASGSGKTTLLNVLTQRNLGRLNTQGTILVNGRVIGEEINSVSGYIQQDDLFVGTLTVREHLWFNALLRMDRDISDSKRNDRIEEVLQEMGLKKCGDTVIGVPGMVKGLSGGEKKRLAFASELLTRPSIMFCDEPTSGLDSFMAQNVVESLKKLTNRGRTVLCTIHQPSSEVFAMFDEILLMAEGRVAFMGPTREMEEFFSDMGYTCPRNYNPADFFIMSLAVVPGKERECRETVSTICDTYDESSYARAIQYQTEEQEAMGNDKFVMEMDNIGKNMSKSEFDKMKQRAASTKIYQASWFMQFYMCLWRSVIDAKRNKRVLPARVLQLIVAGLFLGALYWQQEYTTTGVSNINGALFMLMIQVSFNVAFTIATAFAREFPVFMKENQDRQYCVSAYYLGKILIDLPIIAFASLIYTTCSYWMIGLYPSATAFFTSLAALLLMSQIAVGYGHLASALFPNPQLALTLLPFLLGLTLLFSGFLIKQNSIVKIFKPIAWISSFRYCYEILIVNQWREVSTLDCDFVQQASDLRSSMNITTNYTSTDHSQSSNWCYPNGLAVIYSYQYEVDSLPICFAINACIFFAVELLGYLALRFKASQKT